MQIVKAEIHKNQPGVWCEYELKLTTANQLLPGQRYNPSPNSKVQIYTKKKCWENSTAYFYTDGEDVSFFVHNPRDERGYGGIVFNILVEQPDMSIVREAVVGPYSSNAAAMADLGFAQAVSVLFEGNLSGHITKHFAERILREYNLPLHYAPTDWSKGTYVLYPNK